MTVPSPGPIYGPPAPTKQGRHNHAPSILGANSRFTGPRQSAPHGAHDHAPALTHNGSGDAAHHPTAAIGRHGIQPPNVKAAKPKPHGSHDHSPGVQPHKQPKPKPSPHKHPKPKPTGHPHKKPGNKPAPPVPHKKPSKPHGAGVHPTSSPANASPDTGTSDLFGSLLPYVLIGGALLALWWIYTHRSKRRGK